MNKFAKFKTNKYILYAYITFLHMIIFLVFANWKMEKTGIILRESFQKTNLLIVIMTAPQNKDQRDIIRNTWLNLKSHNMMHFFFIGALNLDPILLKTIEEENGISHDIIFLMSVSEAYQIISYKLLAMLQWADSNINYKYLLKVDDDSFVKLDALNNDILPNLSDNSYVGYFVGNANVKTSGKWAENEWFLCDYYLPYARGGGYILSYNIVKFIANNTPYLQVYNNEDTSLGVWTSPLNITRVHDVRFNTEFVSRGCNESYIIMHKQSMDDMLNLYELYIKSHKICEKELTIFPTYEYNWNVPPSKCCLRV